jgi:HEAT repeat protein
MRSRTGLLLAMAASLIVAVAVYRWLQPEVTSERGSEPRASAAPMEPRPGAQEPTGAESSATPDAAFDLAGDALERALPELVELSRAGNNNAYEAILRGLDDPGNQARERSVLALGAVGDRSALAALEPLVRDPDSDVREGLVKALVKLGGAEAKPMLIDLAMDVDPDVAEDAIQALVSANYTAAIPTIRDVLARAGPMLKVKAASALRQLGDHASADTALHQVARGLDSPSAIERRAAVADIRTIGGKAALPYLERALEDSELPIRREAGRAMTAVVKSLEP